MDIENLEGEVLAVGRCKSCLVVPGLIDFHAHAAYGISDFFYAGRSRTDSSGITSMVDAGSTRVTDFEAFITVILLPV